MRRPLVKRLQEPAPSRPTVNDVARAAGVSTATVSRVLNASADVSEALKIKVTQTMEQMGYVRDATARALATKRSFLLGLILPRRMEPFGSSVLAAFENTNKANGFGTLLVRSSWTRTDIRESLRHLLENGVEGVFSAGPLEETNIAALIMGREFTLITLADGEAVCGTATDTGPSATAPGAIDLALGATARRLAANVTAMGHRRIAIVTEPLVEAPICSGLAHGIGQNISAAGISAPLIIETDCSIEAGAHAFAALMEQPEPPTMVFCFSDALAMGMLFEAGRRGLAVPQDVSIAALTSPRAARAMTPALSGIELDPTEIGALAAESLNARIKARPVAHRLRLPATVTLRDSLGPPKAE
ncbi:hypothetical protein MNBD_ALPHA09-1174 [hydrothermal vent metagenome]|uniref:HTH lacI-type domain-containing protein n=1 Tax=hydrothermal vent metagenome TaxID=652676 RepID=A0A3B0SW33_9ZZZZ